MLSIALPTDMAEAMYPGRITIMQPKLAIVNISPMICSFLVQCCGKVQTLFARNKDQPIDSPILHTLHPEMIKHH